MNMVRLCMIEGGARGVAAARVRNAVEVADVSMVRADGAMRATLRLLDATVAERIATARNVDVLVLDTIVIVKSQW